MDIEARINPNEKPVSHEVVVEGVLWTARFSSDQQAAAERQKRLLSGATALLAAARRIRDWLDNHLIPNFRRGLYGELEVLDDAIAKSEGESKTKPRTVQLVPVETWCRLCDILGCSPDLPYEDVLLKAEILAKSWKQGGQ